MTYLNHLSSASTSQFVQALKILVVFLEIVWIVDFTWQSTGQALDSFLGALAEFRQVALSFVVSVRKVQRGSNWTDFHEIW